MSFKSLHKEHAASILQHQWHQLYNIHMPIICTYFSPFLSTPVLMHGGLLCIAFCLSVRDWTKIRTRQKVTRSKFTSCVCCVHAVPEGMCWHISHISKPYVSFAMLYKHADVSTADTGTLNPRKLTTSNVQVSELLV